MKMHSVVFENAESLESWLGELEGDFGGAPTTLFHIFCDCWADEEIPVIHNAIRKVFPHAYVVGSSSYGNVCEGRFQKENIVVAATAFELESSKVEVLSYPLKSGEATAMGASLVAEIAARPWVKGVEALVMNNSEPLEGFCREIEKLPKDIEVFGGESHFGHAPDAPRYVIDNEGEVLRWGAVFVLYGGEDLHFTADYVQGWRPLGNEMEVTSHDGNVLFEIENGPAYDPYHRYLNIAKDDEFFFNALEFPFLFTLADGVEVMRTPIAYTDDGALVLAAAVPHGAKMRIAYGDPEEILHSVMFCGGEIAEFRPDAILLFTCGVRRTFWNDEGTNRETAPFQDVAPTAGFYTAGELLRMDGRLLEHNSTMVVMAAREGDASEKPKVKFTMPVERRRKSLVARFANFVDAAMDELNAANRSLEIQSRTDDLTGLANRREIETRIREACVSATEGCPSLIMCDLDNFKGINDRFGHREGDRVLQRFAHLSRDVCESAGTGVRMGRWGGEEFIILVNNPACDAVQIAEQIRVTFEQFDGFDNEFVHTVSLGVTSWRSGDDADAIIIRSDEALYAAKAKGKNQIVIA